MQDGRSLTGGYTCTGGLFLLGLSTPELQETRREKKSMRFDCCIIVAKYLNSLTICRNWRGPKNTCELQEAFSRPVPQHFLGLKD